MPTPSEALKSDLEESLRQDTVPADEYEFYNAPNPDRPFILEVDGGNLIGSFTFSVIRESPFEIIGIFTADDVDGCLVHFRRTDGAKVE